MLTDGIPRTGRSPRPAAAPDRDRLREPIMSLTLTDEGLAKLITVSGEIDMSNAHLLTELVEFVCRQPAPVIALDLSRVRFFGAHAVSALLQAQDIATDARAAVLLRDPAPCVTYILATTGALRSFRFGRTCRTPESAARPMTVPPPIGGIRDV